MSIPYYAMGITAANNGHGGIVHGLYPGARRRQSDGTGAADSQPETVANGPDATPVPHY